MRSSKQVVAVIRAVAAAGLNRRAQRWFGPHGQPEITDTVPLSSLAT